MKSKTVVNRPELFWVDTEIPGLEARHPSLPTISCCTLDRLGGFDLILVLQGYIRAYYILPAVKLQCLPMNCIKLIFVSV